MGESNENTYLSFSNREDVYEETSETEEKDERKCLAAECVFVRWSKLVTVRGLQFVSKNTLLIHAEKTLIFHDVKTRKENVLMVGGNHTTPSSSETLTLDGVGCVCCGADLFALAEHPPASKIIVCRYPDLKILATLVDSSSRASYKSMSFVMSEYLIGLRGRPAFDLVLWAWRVEEMLYVVNTGFVQPNQSVYVTGAGNDVHVGQSERDATCRLQLWTFSVSCRTVYAERTAVRLPDAVDVGSGCWTPGGWFVFCDTSANVHRVRTGAPAPETCAVDKAASVRGRPRSRALVCARRHGFVLYNRDRLTCFKDAADGVFTKTWTVVVDHEILCMVAADETFIYGWSKEGALLELTQNKTQTLKVYGTHVKYFTFVKPTDKAVATIDAENVLRVYDVFSGEHQSELKLNGIVTHLCSNPLYHYVAVSFENGKVELLAIDPETNGSRRVSKMVLCDEPLSSVDFFDGGKECVISSFPTGLFYHVNIELGRTCSVKKEFHFKNRVLDAATVEKKKSPLLAVLYENRDAAVTAEDGFGNSCVVLFDAAFNVVFEARDTRFLYASICRWAASFDAPDVVNIALTVTSSKRVHLMAVNVKTKASKVETVTSDHCRRSVKLRAGKNNCLTFSEDGSYGLYEFDEYGQWTKIVTVSCGHWQTGGLTDAQADRDGRNVLALTRHGNFLCTGFRETCEHARRSRGNDAQLVIVADNVETEGFGFENYPETAERKTWTMMRKMDEENAIKLKHSEQKNEIATEFEQIKKELLALLEANTNGPDDVKIDLEEFDLNADSRAKFKDACKRERDEYEAKVLDDIDKFRTATKNIINEYWEPLFVKPKSIYCLKNIYIVEKYPAGIGEQIIMENAGQVLNKRMTIKDQDGFVSVSSADTSQSRNYMDLLDHETVISESDNRQSNDRLMLGSITHRFLHDVIELRLNHQFHYKLESAKDEIVLLRYVVYELQRSFNALFDNLFAEKQRLLDKLNAYNDRLREIEIEFELACKIEPTGFVPVDYDWNQYEQTEQLTFVEDNEVTAESPLTTSDRETVANSERNERDRRTSAVREFRQRALMKMMDGVLEKRWEDELKTDVLTPQCMETKKPEEYVEDDYRAINEYEKSVATKDSERTKYRRILEEEKTKIVKLVAKNIESFDENVFDLFQTKIRYNAAINQERMKIIRLAKLLSDSDERKIQIRLNGDERAEIEKTVEETVEKISTTEAVHGSLLNTIETLKQKNNVLSKRFRSEFPSKGRYEQALTVFNRTPKMPNVTNYSTLLGYQFANTITNPHDDKQLDRLCAEFVKYLESLRTYDDYKYVEENQLHIDRKTWDKICYYRRLKIESDLRIVICQKDVADKMNLMNKLERDKKHKETLLEQMKTRITQIENQNLHYGDDSEIQLVLKQGNVEIPLTGCLKDFDNTTLLPKNEIDEVNAEIKEVGKRKINLLSKLLKFKNEHRFLKWDHKIIKEHELELYKYRYNFITAMKMSENMIHYFKFKMKGLNIAQKAEHTIDNELLVLKTNFLKEKKQLQQRLDKIINDIREVTRENKKIDKNIVQANLQLFNIKSKIDPTIMNQLKLINDTRTETTMKHSKMMAKIKALHTDVMALEKELESLLEKSYPDLYVIPVNSSCAQ